MGFGPAALGEAKADTASVSSQCKEVLEDKKLGAGEKSWPCPPAASLLQSDSGFFSLAQGCSSCPGLVASSLRISSEPLCKAGERPGQRDAPKDGRVKEAVCLGKMQEEWDKAPSALKDRDNSQNS